MAVFFWFHISDNISIKKKWPAPTLHEHVHQQSCSFSCWVVGESTKKEANQTESDPECSQLQLPEVLSVYGSC